MGADKGNKQDNLRDDHFWDIQILWRACKFHLIRTIIDRMLPSGMPLHPESKTVPALASVPPAGQRQDTSEEISHLHPLTVPGLFQSFLSR